MKKVLINVANLLKVKRLPSYIIPEIRQHLIIDNPQWYENEKHGRWNGKTPKKLRYISEDSTIMPRGFLSVLRKILKSKDIDYHVRYQTISRPISQIKSNISFKDRTYAIKATEKILKKKFGILQAPTGAGKTVIAIEVITKRAEQALIVVHTKELMYQWEAKLLEFTDLKEEEIGLIGDGKNKIGKITVGIINSLEKITGLNNEFGFVIVDEVHRCPSTIFSKFITNLNTKYMLGLSATPYRRDGLTPVIHFYMGNTIYSIKTKLLQKQGHIMKANLKIIKTEFSPYIWSAYQYPKVIKSLTEDEDRNNLIVQEILNKSIEQSDKEISLVISDRKEHCSILFNKISIEKKPLLLTGSTTNQERVSAIEKLRNGEVKILIATGQLIGEGFDSKYLSSIFITTPIKFEGRLIQYIGRILRIAEGKTTATIIDFNDPCWLLRSSFTKRMKAYKEMGIKEIQNEI